MARGVPTGAASSAPLNHRQSSSGPPGQRIDPLTDLCNRAAIVPRPSRGTQARGTGAQPARGPREVRMLRLESLTRRFGDKMAVDGVNLVVQPGSFVGVIGRSGAGKSTLLRMINRLQE